MGRLITAISILILIVAGSIVNIYAVDHAVQPVADLLIQSAQALDSGKPAAALTKMQEAMDSWHDASAFLGTVILHSEIDDVDVDFDLTQGYLENGDYTQFRVYQKSMVQKVLHLKDMERISVVNIF